MKIFRLIAILAFYCSSTVHACVPSEESLTTEFQSYDMNNDNVVTKIELMAHVETLKYIKNKREHIDVYFESNDMNKDDKILRDEFHPLVQRRGC